MLSHGLQCRLGCRSIPEASLWLGFLGTAGLGPQIMDPGSNATWLVPTDDAIKLRLALGEVTRAFVMW